MTTFHVRGADIFYINKGEGSETIIFSHGFLLSHKMFQYQIDELSKKYHIIAYDHRGQGQSEVTENGYDIDSYTEDAYELITQLVDGKVHFVGLSTGGFVGLRLALKYPDLLKSLILINTTSKPASSYKKFKFKILRGFERVFGIKPVVGQAIKTLFGKTFRKDLSNWKLIKLWKDEIRSNSKMGMYKSFEAAVYREDITDQLHNIEIPCLIIGGQEDVGLSPEESEIMHENLPNSTLIILKKVGHSSTIEAPKRVTNEIETFLKKIK